MRELLERISSRELTEWMAYYSIEPFGEERADLRAAIIASTVANSNRDPKRQPRPYTPEDFLPKFGPEEKKVMDWKDQLTLVEVLNEAFGGKDMRK